MKLALLLVASAAAWVAPLPRVAHRVARARALRSTADEDASKLADEAAKLRAEIAELEGPSAPAPAPAAADAAAEPAVEAGWLPAEAGWAAAEPSNWLGLDAALQADGGVLLNQS